MIVISKLGIIVINAVIFIVVMVLMNCVAKALALKAFNGEQKNKRVYTNSVAGFAFISVSIMIFLIDGLEKIPDSNIVSSGLLLTIGTVVAGILAKLLYKAFAKIMDWYMLNEEIKWTFVFVCICFAVLCWIGNEMLYCCTFFAFVFGRLCWFDFSKQTVQEELRSLKCLPETFLYAWGVIIHIIFIAKVYGGENMDFLFAIIGHIIGRGMTRIIENKKTCGK